MRVSDRGTLSPVAYPLSFHTLRMLLILCRHLPLWPWILNQPPLLIMR